MKGEVNPEMESVRKLVSGRLETRTAGPHPDADLLSTFAENALPDAERGRVLAHLADCRECREVVFLSLPQPADGQKILIPRPGRWHLALQWGTAVASIVIIAGVFAARHELFRHPEPLAKSAPASQLPTQSKVAEEKTTADLDSMTKVGSQNQAVRAPMHVPERGRPDLKHMTAKMQRTLTFGQSDEVQVSPSASPNLTSDSRAIRDFPIQGRNAVNLNDLASGQSPASPKALTANARENRIEVEPVQNQDALVETPTRAMVKEAALNPQLAGTVLDVSGAVVANAKVTTVGPVETETVTSDAQGRFAFDARTPGIYSVKAAASGFRPTELKLVTVAANQSPSLQLKLTPASEMETVEVSGQAVVAESPAASLDGNIPANAATAGKAEKKARRQGNWKGAPTGGMAAGRVPAPQWTISPTGAVQSSTDGGRTWQMVAIAVNTSFRTLSAVGASVWVGGSGGILYHSLDSGRNWTPVVPAIKGQKLNSEISRIEFLDSQDGSLSTSNGEIWITHDGGNTWDRN